MKIKYLHIVFIVLIFNKSIAQSTKSKPIPNPADDKYQPKYNKVLVNDDKTSTKTKHVNDFNNAFKFEATGILLGRAIVSYENFISNDFSIEPIIGFTFKTDPIQKLIISDLIELNNVAEEGIGIESFFPAESVNTLGRYFGVNFKYYLNGDDPFNGPYYGFSYRNSTNNFTFNSYSIPFLSPNEYTFISSDRNIKLINNSFLLMLGAEKSIKKTTHDFYASVGFSILRYDKYIVSSNTNTNYGAPNYNVTKSVGKYTRDLALYFTLGYSFGFGF